MSKPKITLVLDSLRSIYNVGSILRTCDCLGVENIIYIGTTPHPFVEGDTRLPFMATKQTNQISKTALGAEQTIAGAYYPSVKAYLDEYANFNKYLIALEQAKTAIELNKYEFPKDCQNLHLVVGNEVTGVSEEMLAAAQEIIEIPMQGRKESLNVEVATAISVYQLLSM